MATDWKDYQEEAASFFRSLGLEATTDKTIKGVRTEHDIDVLVTSHHAGFDVTWIVECKYWKKPVSKLHVLALREIVADSGVDRGILLSESGFQSGAIEAANLTNVQVTSLAELSLSASNDIISMRLREIYDRVGICKDRYWDISKADRKAHGLRPELGESGYSGATTIELCNEILTRAFRGIFPFTIDNLTNSFPSEFDSLKLVLNTLEPMISELEDKLEVCEQSIKDT
ncbi:restriction endonuclease [Litoribacillus peritrichatus]|uniref:Restriction endonuclease type IV Mrr domain-containing protein n=1 Tax=Litoribacillus peritrichatus TaxID=718191 RepID=A0ABP7MBK0_9GAMM